MHNKAAIIDRGPLFVGSLNMYPRSIKINTDLGLFFDTNGGESAWLDDLEASFDNFTRRLFLDDAGNVQWLYTGAGRNELFVPEPDVSGWDKFVAWMAHILPIKSQL